LEGVNPAAFFGVNNLNLKHLKSFFPKLSIVARGNKITVKGDEDMLDHFEVKFNLMVQHFTQFNALTENNIDNLMLADGEKLLSTDNGS
jgi:phosphate starvation-inducible PhoH-like protein